MKSRKLWILGTISAWCLLLFACSEKEEQYTPKKYGKLRADINLKETQFAPPQLIANTYLSIPKDAINTIKEQDDTVTNFTLERKDYKATFYMTHIHLNNDLRERIEQSNEITKNHLVKADDFYDSLVFRQDSRVYGQVFHLTGNAASNLQFIVTDSSHNLLRGALYFYCAPNYDSLRPYIQLMEKDVYQMINTLEWANFPS